MASTAIISGIVPTFNYFNKIAFILIAIIGIVIKTFFFNDYSDDGLTGPAVSNLWGYGVVTFGLLGILFVNYSALNQNASNKNSIDFIIGLFKSSVPIFLLLLILYWLIMINFNYYTKINKGNISNEFKLYSFVSSFVIFLHLFVVYKYFNTTNDKSKKAFTLLSYLLTLSNIILVGIMTIILLYFSTDG